MSQIWGNLGALTWQMVAMWIIGGVMIYLAICKEMEPTLLLPMGFGCILCNLPNSGAVEVLETLFQAGVANELFPLLLFIGIGAMIDFGPLLADPKLLLFGAAAQFGIFFTLSMASLFGFELRDAASIAIIGAADGPTSIFVANVLKSHYTAAIIVAAYSYMALVPIVQPFCIRLITTKKVRMIRMEYTPGKITKTTRILFPIGGLSDVRQSAARVRRAAQPVRNGAERAGEPHQPAAGADSGGAHAGGEFPRAGNADDSGTRPDRVHV